VIRLLAALALLADPRAELEAARARRAQEEALARALVGREVSVLDTVSEADRLLAEAEAAARQAEAARDAAARREAAAEQEERAAGARLAERLAELGPRVAARARMGRLGELKLLLASSSLGDLVKRKYLLDRIVAHDLEALRDARAALSAREAARAERQREAARAGALAADAQRARAVAAARREEWTTLLAAVRNARQLHERAAAEAAGQEQKLGQYLAALPADRAAAAAHTGFAAMRGRLPHPADGPIEVGFGRVVNPRFHTVTVQKGVDLRAPAGAPVRAVAAGRVAHAGWFKGYGNLVIVDHGEGYHTLLAHLATMTTAIGEEVTAGTLLGTVGETGSLKGPYLYFEIRDHGRPLDPGEWLLPDR
jgi:murein DD-endopeptidase MepM/ murein hydrolase activator NlpD